MSNLIYSIKAIMETSACTGCHICADACPAASAAGDGRLSGVYRLEILRKMIMKRSGMLGRLLGGKKPSAEQLDQFSGKVFRCTLCGSCQEVCPSGIRLKELWLSLRQDLVLSSPYPEKIDMIRDNITGSHNTFDEDNEERADWVENMRNPPDHGFIKDRAEVVYFTGCVASYFPTAQKIPMAFAEILEIAGVDFTLLGEDEWCCGFPLLGAGLKELTRDIIAHNIKAVRARGAKTVVFSCPSCYRMWLDYYPREFRLYHETQYLHQLLLKDHFSLNQLSMTVTYHDPCDLARGAKVFDAPRNIIDAIPGVTLVEMAQNRENSRCCGGGGNLEMIDAGLASEIAKLKIEDVLRTGAQAVVTSCQQCGRTMNTYVKRNKVDLAVMDITELVHRALKR